MEFTFTAHATRFGAILHNAAMDVQGVATEEDPAQMWEEAHAIASRILAACPNVLVNQCGFPPHLN